jgi:pyruvate dehydrogenase E1 component alpha subunit
MTEDALKDYTFFKSDKSLLTTLGKDILLKALSNMLLIRHFEIRAEAGYLNGKIGGFFHSYQGQEATITAIYDVFGPNHWYVGTYRCHGVALTLGVLPDAIMAELYGKKTGNAQGRGGSMHLYHHNLLGGFGIVGGQIPVATGAAFSSKYLDNSKIALCFLGDGTVPQGTFHESLNMASLWNLPCLYIIENNIWGMGTYFKDANCMAPLAEKIAPSYNMESYTIDGTNYFDLYAALQEIYTKIQKTKRPILIEVIAARFRGHSISDPGLYRPKEEVQKAMKEHDPIILLYEEMKNAGFITEDVFKKMIEQFEQMAIKAQEYAEKSPWPDETELEEGVYC